MQCDKVERTAEDRSETRSSVYIAGTVSWLGRSVPAKIRNLSTGGALLEAAELPTVGAAVRVIRGSLETDGVVAWKAVGRCGVRFGSLVNVREWISPNGNHQQRRIDETVALLKAGGAGPEERARPEVAHVAMSPAITVEELAADLRELCLLIDEIGSEMMKDEELIRRHPLTLQNVDIVSQSIEAVAGLLSSKAPDVALGERLCSLRASRTEALKRRLAAAVGPN